MLKNTIFYQRLDTKGSELLQLFAREYGWFLVGAAVFLEDGEPYSARYKILCDSEWCTRRVDLVLHSFDGERTFDFDVTSDKVWAVNGTRLPGLAGCTNIDLGFTPASNALPIRRLGLAIGEEAVVEVAWLKFPSLEVVRAQQRYRRIDARRYRYENLGSRFSAEITTDQHGLVTHYPQLWQAVE